MIDVSDCFNSCRAYSLMSQTCTFAPSAAKPRAIANHFVKALKIDPKYADASYNKGTVLYNLGKYNEALLEVKF